MKRPAIYSIVFTLLLCSACALALTTVNGFWASRIKANEELERFCAVVMSLGLVPLQVEREEVVATYGQCVVQSQQGCQTLYTARRDGSNVVGYAVEISGRGRYGPIRGILAIKPDRKHIKALAVYECHETPGLGHEITKPWWRKHFVGLPMVTDGIPGIVISKTAGGPNVVPPITGASKTCFAMQKMINLAIAQFLVGGMDLKEMDLELVGLTRASPNPPRVMKRPANLEPRKRRAAFLVPEGTVNLAEGRPVTSSMGDFEPLDGTLDMITDGSKMCGDHDIVQLESGPQWVQVDLGERHTVYGVGIWHFYRNTRVYTDVIVQVADDADFNVNTRILFNNDDDNSAGQGTGTNTTYWTAWWGELVDARGEQYDGEEAQYVRVWTGDSCDGQVPCFSEVTVYGRPR